MHHIFGCTGLLNSSLQRTRFLNMERSMKRLAHSPHGACRRIGLASTCLPALLRSISNMYENEWLAAPRELTDSSVVIVLDTAKYNSRTCLVKFRKLLVGVLCKYQFLLWFDDPNPKKGCVPVRASPPLHILKFHATCLAMILSSFIDWFRRRSCYPSARPG
jgi:hypothetical protein